jgi:microcystin-dependent protein
MSDPFVGEIRMVGFNFAPQGWAMCNGQLLPIAQNTALFSLLGTNYGGDGRSTFGLPNLQASFPMHWGNGGGVSERVVGETGGEQSVTLLTTELAAHRHTPQAVTGGGDSSSPSGAVWAEAREGRALEQIYATSGATAPMLATAVLNNGGSQPHNNLPPYLVVNFVIAMVGIYPARS